MDIRYSHSAQIYVVRVCYDALDLIAVGGESHVDVLQLTSNSCEKLASFHVGSSRITALAWSSRTVSPSSSDQWFLELTAASADFGLHLLTKSQDEEEIVFPFGGGLSGHHGKVTDMSFCGGSGEDSARYIASVSEDKMLMIWDLNPALDISFNPEADASPPQSPRIGTSSPPPRSRPTAYVIPFPHPLTAVDSHPATSKEFLVADCRGSIFIADWRSDPEDEEQEKWRHSSLVEFVEPRALSDATTGLYNSQWSGSVSWRRDTTDIVGAAYGSKFSIWDMSKLHGGKPTITGNTFPEGGCNRFRWCQTYPDYFAISSPSPAKGAVINVYNYTYPHAQPTIFNIAPRPHLVRDFDFLGVPGRVPQIAAGVGSELIIFAIGME